MNDVFENYERQNYPEKELIVVLNKDNMSIDRWQAKGNEYENVTIYQLPENTPLWECFNYGIEKSSYPYVFKLDDDDYYSPFYIKEQINCFYNSNADIVGKTTSYCYLESQKALLLRHEGNENTFVNYVFGATLGLKKEVFRKLKFPPKNMGGDRMFLKKCKEKNIKIYASSKANYVCIRKADPNHHTWKSEEKNFYRNGRLIDYTDNFRSLVE